MPTELCVLDRVTACDCQHTVCRADAPTKLGNYDKNKRVEYQNSLRIFTPARSLCTHYLYKVVSAVRQNIFAFLVSGHQLKYDGTRRRTGGEVKGKLAN